MIEIGTSPYLLGEPPEAKPEGRECAAETVTI